MDYLEIVFDNYNENRQQARDQFNLPPWLTRFWIKPVLKDAVESVSIDQSRSSVVIKMSYAHQGGKCYQIRETCVYDWKVFSRTGTLCLFLRIDKNALSEAEIFARRFLADATLAALADYHDPTSGVAAGLLDIGLTAADLGIPSIFGDIFSAKDIADLLDEISEITDKVGERLREIARLRSLDGKKLAEIPNVTHRYRAESVKSFSSVEIVEVECADWILEQAEGEVVRVPDHDESLYPVLPLSDELDRMLEEAREVGSSGESRSSGSLQRAKHLAERMRAEWHTGAKPSC